jgi:hypothetical protein
MNRRILISENERSRILGLHENRRMKEWGLINEQVEGTLSAELKAKNIKITGPIQAPPPGELSNWILIDGSKITAGYYGFVVNNAENSTTFYMDNGMTLKGQIKNTQTNDMIYTKLPNWTDKPIAGAKTVLVGAGTTTDNAKTTTDNAKFIPKGYESVEACKADYKTTYLSGVSMKVFGQYYTVIQKKWLESKCVGKTPCDKSGDSNTNLAMAICEGTFNMSGPVATPAASTESTSSTASTAVVPLASTPSEYTVYKGGVPSKMTVDQISQGLADGTIKPTDKVWDTSKGQGSNAIVPLSTLTSDTKIQASIKTIAPELAAERKSTNIPELDAWLKGPIGSAWDKLTDPKQKESMFDSFEKTDPTITKLKDTVGKGPSRSALGMAADTGLGRGLQRLRGRVGSAITGNQPVA